MKDGAANRARRGLHTLPLPLFKILDANSGKKAEHKSAAGKIAFSAPFERINEAARKNNQQVAYFSFSRRRMPSQEIEA